MGALSHSAEEVRNALMSVSSYAFPGNVRELKNIIERALIESGAGEIRPEHLHFTNLREAAAAPPSPADSGVNHVAKFLPLKLLRTVYIANHFRHVSENSLHFG